MSRKWFNNKVPDKQELIVEKKLELYSIEKIDNFTKHFNSYALDLAANDVLDLAINTNLYLNEKQPWVLIKNNNNINLVSNIIYNVLESIRIIGILLLPLLPDLSSNIDKQLGTLYDQKQSWKEQLKWGKLIHGSTLPAPNPIIQKLEYE